MIERAQLAASRINQLATAVFENLRAARPWRSPTVLIVVAVNILLAVLYLWSRGGATLHMRIETIDSHYRAYVDGKLIAETDVQSGGQGGIAIALPGDQVPSLPSPSGIDSVRVTNTATGEVVLNDTFDGKPNATWSSTSGNWHIERGAYATSQPGFLTTNGYDWGNYVVDLKFKNPTIVTVRLWRLEGDSVVFKIWPYDAWPPEAYDSRLTVQRDGQTIAALAGSPLEPDHGELIQSITAMVLRPYPLALLVIAGVIGVALAFSVRLDRQLGAIGQLFGKISNVLILGVVAGTFVLLWYINYVVADAMPHVPDSVAYVFQAKIFASFHVTANPPPNEPSFTFFQYPFMHVVDGDWFTQYPFGHPLILAIGERLGAIWLVPPALGAASVFLIYRLGARVHGAAAGMVAALLLLFSPFFQMTASDYMSHNTAGFVILACVALLARGGKRRMLWMFGAGIFLGLLFNMRSLVAMAFIPVLGAFMAYELWRAGDERVQVFKGDVAFAVGGLIMLLAYFGYNEITTGVFTDSPQTLTSGEISGALGFSAQHTLSGGLQNEQQQLALMVLVANGWPAAIGLLFAGLPFLLGTRNRWDYFFGASFLLLTGANIFYVNTSIMHGPRYWYESLPFLILLSARGVLMVIERTGDAADWLAARLGWRPEASGRAIAGVAVFGLVAGLMASSADGFMLGRRDLWSGIDFTPQRISILGDRFNFVDGRLLSRADEMDLDNALVFVAPCGGWWCYSSVFWTNNPGLDGNVVWANQTFTELDLELIDQYPGRTFYLADYADGSIRPLTAQELEAAVQRADARRKAAQQ